MLDLKSKSNMGSLGPGPGPRDSARVGARVTRHLQVGHPIYFCFTKPGYVQFVKLFLPDEPREVIEYSWNILPYAFIWDEGEPLVILPYWPVRP